MNPSRHSRKALAAMLLSLLMLAGCATTAPHTTVTGSVERIIDLHDRPETLPSCLASRRDRIEAGVRYAAIRYRHWASHFRRTVYAELPPGQSLALHQQVQIEPGQCSHNELAVIVADHPATTSHGALQ